jgi:hypothetical protein
MDGGAEAEEEVEEVGGASLGTGVCAGVSRKTFAVLP